ncbi:MAG TPA: DNA repair protein RadA, partial [Flavobacteriales bacterium]|nr:DNA repair protein RadA [Flavobacteriales bacterium]
MAKAKRQFVCTACGHAHPQWVGQCAGCKAWNTLEEQTDLPPTQRAQRAGAAMLAKPSVQRLADVSVSESQRLSLGNEELNRVLGGGAVPGGVVLLGGEPGIGKSTLMLQVALMAGKEGLNVLYVSGEESPDQVKMRANRLGSIPDNVLIYPETQVQGVLDAMNGEKPSLVVIDSIQTMDMAGLDGVPGSV